MNEVALCLIGINVALSAIMNICTIFYIERKQKYKLDEYLDGTVKHLIQEMSVNRKEKKEETNK
jgi:hypothetical protein